MAAVEAEAEAVTEVGWTRAGSEGEDVLGGLRWRAMLGYVSQLETPAEGQGY